MPQSPKKKAAKFRFWRVSIIRKRGQYLETVEAPNEQAAEAAAVADWPSFAPKLYFARSVTGLTHPPTGSRVMSRKVTWDGAEIAGQDGVSGVPLKKWAAG